MYINDAWSSCTCHMRSNIKFIIRDPYSMPVYETDNSVDLVVSHTSYSTLYGSLARKGVHLITIHQGILEIVDEESYSLINTDKRLTALYRRTDVSPLTYNAFQG